MNDMRKQFQYTIKIDAKNNNSYIDAMIESKLMYIDFEDNSIDFASSKPIKIELLRDIVKSYELWKETYQRRKENIE